MITACRRKNVRVTAPSSAVPALQVPAGTVERGVASWYGKPYHGRPAADGEIYDMEQLVAAHRTLPFQTRVSVHNLATGKTVEVRIIDRGPFVEGRIIDLSHKAAQEIEMIGSGIAQVEVTVLSAPVSATPAQFGVQVGAFRDKANADRMERAMITAYGAGPPGECARAIHHCGGCWQARNPPPKPPKCWPGGSAQSKTSLRPL